MRRSFFEARLGSAPSLDDGCVLAVGAQSNAGVTCLDVDATPCNRLMLAGALDGRVSLYDLERTERVRRSRRGARIHRRVSRMKNLVVVPRGARAHCAESFSEEIR